MKQHRCNAVHDTLTLCPSCKCPGLVVARVTDTCENQTTQIKDFDTGQEIGNLLFEGYGVNETFNRKRGHFSLNEKLLSH